jgi:hypothetical protein
MGCLLFVLIVGCQMLPAGDVGTCNYMNSLGLFRRFKKIITMDDIEEAVAAIDAGRDQ